MKNNINWEKMGLLDGEWVKSENQREILKKELSNINIDNYKNSSIEFFTAPVILKIINLILNETDEKYHENLLNMMNIDYICDKLLDYVDNYLAIGLKYLPDIDSEAELLVLYARNYYGELLKKLK